MLKDVSAIITSAIAQRIFPGAVVLVALDGALRLHAAYGTTMYDAPGSQPVAPNTIYDVASLTKVFTAMAVLRLVDAGLIDLHAPASTYLPELRATDVRVIHLLTHTSGLDLRLSALRERGRAGLRAAVFDALPTHAPGTVVAYSNVNALLLGEIVERIVGTSFDDALRRLVIAPLGLRDTLFSPPPALLPRIAPTEIDAEWRGGLVHGRVHDESTHALGGSAGHAGLFSTAADLAVFCGAWLDMIRGQGSGVRGQEEATRLHVPSIQASGVSSQTMRGPDPSALTPDSWLLTPDSWLLTPATARMATTNQTPEMPWACGLGWMIDRANFMGAAPAGSFGHTGFTGPALVVVPARRLVVVVLSNRVYPQRQPPPYRHHAVTAAIVAVALRGAVIGQG